MIHRIEVRMKKRFGDPHAEGIAGQIKELGIHSVKGVRFARLFFLAGELSAGQVERVGRELLADPVTEEFFVGTSDTSAEGTVRTAESTQTVPPGKTEQNVVANPATTAAEGTLLASKQCHPEALIEVHLKLGVMDPVAASTEKAIADMGLPPVAVRTARRYELSGEVLQHEQAAIARRLLANDCIEDAHFQPFTPPETHPHSYQLTVHEIPIRQLDDAGLVALSREKDLFLNLTEMKAIQEHYRALGRDPREIEVETIAQTWSEHCVHKTFRSDVRVTDARGNFIEEIPNLIKNTIFAATQKLAKPWCVSVFKDNAGVIDFDENFAVCFKVETHNHPSALDPYGGAGTGIGGVIRDPMGTGMGARPIANTDVFCFGPADMPLDQVPKGVLHPRRIMRGVVAGVRDYGNRMGIPTVNGAVYFDEKYVGNPLVFCGTVGLIPRDMCFKQVKAGDACVVVGGRTGRDGIHGATFSSGELTHEHETEFSGAVQIGNAITEKKMLDTIIQARDAGLYDAITDCGAGGLSSAVGEMGEELGAEVHLDRVPLKYAGLRHDEIWISEAQERMVLAVPQSNVDAILKLFASEDVEATVIGQFGTPGSQLRLLYGGTLVGELAMGFLHNGIPKPTKEAVWAPDRRRTPTPRPKKDYSRTLLKMLALPNVASKEWIIRQYDHEVQGQTVVKPLVGEAGDGPGDASVLRPVYRSRKGLVVSCGMNPRFGELDPYQSALHAIDEALRNCVAVGGNIERTAILDNFCWGNCNKPDRMGALVQSAKACYDGALAYGVPFISGKDSLNNEFVTDEGRTIAIPPTLLISAISVIDDVGLCVTADAKAAGNALYLVGATSGHLGGSHFLLAEGKSSGSDVPPVDPEACRANMLAVQKAIAGGLVRACHDLSEGGLAVAAAEMAFAGGLGVALDIFAMQARNVSVPALLFGESAGRFLLEVSPEKSAELEALLSGVPATRIGQVTDTGRIVINAGPDKLIDVEIAKAKAAWQKTFGKF